MFKGRDRQATPRVAYFCMEYGLNHELPIYAGGLGVLAGDYLKAAKDLGLPMVGLGILWRNDYTEQFIGDDGRPYDSYPRLDYDFLEDTGVSVQVQVRGMDVTCKVRKVTRYGNGPLYLLDTNFPGSEHGWMTSKLYGGAEQDRVAAEIILGIGGVRALRALELPVDIYHLNEGHAVFAGTELIRERTVQGMSFEEAWRETRKQIVFTTHTPVEAGNEVHHHELLQLMGAYNGLTHREMREIGGDPFNMTVAALRLSNLANGVSKIHGQVASEMWKDVHDRARITSITNGVHPQTWQHPDIAEAYLHRKSLWPAHAKNKGRLLEYVARTTGKKLNPDGLVVGFARRAAPYKRSDLIFRNPEVIAPLIEQGKLQLIFSGKAHPNDYFGKDIIADLVKMDKRFGNGVVFLENYNMGVAELLVRGCDVWLNNPRRPLEASGTSGMKAAMNGVLNLSVVDGWVGEGLQHGISGWFLDSVIEKQAEAWDQDAEDLKALYQILLHEVIPIFYENRQRWEEMMSKSIEHTLERFSTQRMIREYYDGLYGPTMNQEAGETLVYSPSPWMTEQQEIRREHQYEH